MLKNIRKNETMVNAASTPSTGNTITVMSRQEWESQYANAPTSPMFRNTAPYGARTYEDYLQAISNEVKNNGAKVAPSSNIVSSNPFSLTPNFSNRSTTPAGTTTKPATSTPTPAPAATPKPASAPAPTVAAPKTSTASAETPKTITVMGKQEWESKYAIPDGSPIVNNGSPYGAKTYDEYMQAAAAEAKRTGAKLAPSQNTGPVKPTVIPPSLKPASEAGKQSTASSNTSASVKDTSKATDSAASSTPKPATAPTTKAPTTTENANTITVMGRQEWESKYAIPDGSPIVNNGSPYGARTYDEYMQAAKAEADRTGATLAPSQNTGPVKPTVIPPDLKPASEVGTSSSDNLSTQQGTNVGRTAQDEAQTARYNAEQVAAHAAQTSNAEATETPAPEETPAEPSETPTPEETPAEPSETPAPEETPAEPSETPNPSDSGAGQPAEEKPVNPNDYYESSGDYGEGATRETSEPVTKEDGSVEVTTTIKDSEGNQVGTETATYADNKLEVEYKDANGETVRRETYDNPSASVENGEKPVPSSTTDYSKVYNDNGDVVGSREVTTTSAGYSRDKTVTNNYGEDGSVTGTTETTVETNGNSPVTTTTTINRDNEGKSLNKTVVTANEETDTYIEENYNGSDQLEKRTTRKTDYTKTEEFANGSKEPTRVEINKREGNKVTTEIIETTEKGKTKTITSETKDENGNVIEKVTTRKDYENGKEVYSAKVVVTYDPETGEYTRTTYTQDETKVEKYKIVDGKEEIISTDTKDSLHKFASGYASKGDGTLASNLCVVSDAMSEIKGKIVSHTELSHTASANNEVKIVGAAVAATNYYGNITDALYGNLSAEADAVYEIANTIFQMDNGIAKASELLDSKSSSDCSALYETSSFGRQIADLEAASNTLAHDAQEALATSKSRYNDILEGIGSDWAAEVGSTPGKVSISALNSAILSIVPALNEEVEKANGLSSSVENFMTKIGAGNVLEGGVWDNVLQNMETYKNMLALNKNAANFLSDTIKESLSWLISYLQQIGVDELDTDKLGELRQHYAEVEAKLNSLKEELARGCTPDYDENGYDKNGCEQWLANLQAAIKAVEDELELIDKEIKKIENFIPLLNKAQEAIRDAISQINDAYALPVSEMNSNYKFESTVDLTDLYNEGLLDATKDYSGLIDEYYDKLKAEQAASTTNPDEGDPGGTTATEPPTNPPSTTDDDDDDDTYYGGGDTGYTPPAPELPTDPKTEAPTTAPTEAPTTETEPVTEPSSVPTEPETEPSSVTTEPVTGAIVEPDTVVPTSVPIETPTEAPTSGKSSGGGSKKKSGGGGGGGSSSKKPSNPNVDPLENPSEATIDTQGDLPVDPIEEPVIDDYQEPIIDEVIEPIEDEIIITTEPAKKGNGLRTMGIAAGVGLAVGASALGAHTIMKNKEQEDEGDEDYGYEK